MDNHKVKFCIIGAGVSGLSFANKITNNDYIIVEKEDAVGGYCRTIKQDGFIWDYAGHFFHFMNPEIKKKFSTLLESNTTIYQKKNTKIYYKNALIDYPFQFNIHQLEKNEFIDCLCDLFQINDIAKINSFKEMLYAKFGTSIAEKFLIPYNEKLYSCDLNLLDIDAMGRFFPKAEPIEIVNGFRTKKIQTYNEEFFYSSKGAEAFVNVLMENINPFKIKLSETVKAIDINEKKVYTNKSIIEYEYLINTMPFNVFLKIAHIPHKESYTSNKVLVYNIGFDSKAKDNNLHWIYYPEKKYIFYRVGFYSNILNTDRMSIYVEIGLTEKEKVDADWYLGKVLSDLKEVGIVTSQKIVSYNILEMSPAYVHISNATQKEKETLIEYLRKKNVYTIGRYGNWTYCSLEDCIFQAQNLYNEIA